MPATSSRIHATAIIADDVRLGAHSVIGAFAILGGPDATASDSSRLDVGDSSHVRSHSVVYGGSSIGPGFQTGHGVLIREACRIGASVSVGSHSVVEHHVVLGDGVRLHSNVFVPEFSELEAGAWIGPNVVLTNAKYPRGANVKERLRGPKIAADAKIGANATVLPGITIGAGALVGAGAVVTHHVQPGVIVVGNPARPVGHIGDIEDYRALLDVQEERA